MGKLIDLARESGSQAKTPERAKRYLLAQIARRAPRPIPDAADAKVEHARTPARSVMTRATWRDQTGGHRMYERWNGWRDRHADLIVALDRALKAKARRDRLARVAQDDRDLTAAGYSLTLSEDKRHRVLRGMDDGHPFDVEVPLRVLGIAEALAWLRPDDVPADASRQGEWYFVPCEAPPEPTATWELIDETAAGSSREQIVYETDTFDRRRRHMPTECRVVEERGTTAFLGRKQIKHHSWQGRPYVYVRGGVTHPEHGTLVLEGWHEVVPNRAHGPFAVREPLGGID